MQPDEPHKRQINRERERSSARFKLAPHNIRVHTIQDKHEQNSTH